MTGASATTSEINTFFARYGDAFAARDKDALARCFLFPCHFVGDDGEITLTVISSVEHLAEIIKPLNLLGIHHHTLAPEGGGHPPIA